MVLVLLAHLWRGGCNVRFTIPDIFEDETHAVKLALKIVGICLVAMVLITAFAIYVMARREFHEVREMHQQKVTRVGEIIRESVDVVYRADGHQGIISAIKTHSIQSQGLNYRWVWFDVAVNDPAYPAASMESLEELLDGEGMDSVVMETAGETRLYSYYAVPVSGRTGAIELSSSLEAAEDESWRTMKIGLFAIAAMAIGCIAVVAWAGVRMIGRPLESLMEQTRRIGEGDFNETSKLHTGDEFEDLSRALNDMGQKIVEQRATIENESAARLAAMEQLRHADRLKTVGRLAAGIAHEIGTPLNVVTGRAGLIRSGKLNDQEIEESAVAIQAESDRIAGFVRRLMDYARHAPPRPASRDVRLPLQRTIDLLTTMAAKSNVTIELVLADDNGPFTAWFDEAQIVQVFTNLLVNAIQAMPDGGQVTVRLANVGTAPGGYVQIEIQDDGTGMDEETRVQIFEPFFTTKDVGQGTGLGLSIAQGIIDEHAGSLDVESHPGHGTIFRILLSKSAPETTDHS